MRYTKRPEGSEVIRTYAALEALVAAFFEGGYSLITIIGRPGLGKSWAIEKRTQGDYGDVSHIIKGWAAPLQCFLECFVHKDKLLCFDDTESLWCRAGGRVLLRSLTERKAEKDMKWTSTAGNLKALADEMGLDVDEVKFFTTSSKVCILGNEFPDGEGSLTGSAGIEYAAVLDRGRIFFFDPTPQEIHSHAKWFWDQEIYDYIGKKLTVIHNLSFRLYTKAWEAKVNKEDWKAYIDHHTRNNNYLLVQELEANKMSAEERLSIWAKKSKNAKGEPLSRATYYNYVAELKADGQLKPIKPPTGKCVGKPPKSIDLRKRVEETRKARDARKKAAEEAQEEDEIE